MRHRDIIGRGENTLLVIKKCHGHSTTMAHKEMNCMNFCARRHIGNHEKSISLHKNLINNIHAQQEGNVEFPRRCQQDFSASMEKPSHSVRRMKPAPINICQLRMFVYATL